MVECSCNYNQEFNKIPEVFTRKIIEFQGKTQPVFLAEERVSFFLTSSPLPFDSDKWTPKVKEPL
jgi:hypothetical protein